MSWFEVPKQKRLQPNTIITESIIANNSTPNLDIIIPLISGRNMFGIE